MMVRSCVRVSFSSLWPALMLTSTDADCPHKRIILKVYSDRNVKNIDFIAVRIFQVGQQFMKLESLLHMRCRHRSA